MLNKYSDSDFDSDKHLSLSRYKKQLKAINIRATTAMI